MKAMLRNFRNKVSVGAISIVLVLICSLKICSQTSSAQSISIRSQQELALALLKTESERPADVPSLLKANAQLVSETFWQEILDAAAQRYSQNQQDRAFVLYSIAQKVAVELKSQKLLAKTYYYLGRSYSGLNQFDKAKAAYLESKKAFAAAGLERELVYILSDLGILSFIQEDYSSARSYSEQCVKLAKGLKRSAAPQGAWPDEFGVAGALSTLGELAAREGDISQALDDLRRSVTLYEQLNNTGSYDYYLADVNASLGRVYSLAGDNVQALAAFSKALIISKALKNQQQEASRLNDIGFLYMEQEDYEQAKLNFENSLAIYQRTKNREEARVLLNLGVIEQRQSHYDNALRQFKLSLELAKANNLADIQIAASEGLGVVLTAKRDYSAAISIFNEELTLAQNTTNQDRQAELLWRLAQTYQVSDDHVQAIAFAEKAVSRATQARLSKLTFLALTTLGQSYADSGKTEIAIATLEKAVDQLEALRGEVAGTEVESQLFLENKIAAYHSLVDLFVKKDRVPEALSYAERAKGRVLFDVLRASRTDLSKSLTAEQKEQVDSLNRKISEINDRIKRTDASDSLSLNRLYSDLDASRLEYQAFQNTLYVTHPELKIRNGSTPVLDAAGIKELITNRSALIEYVVTNRQIYLFVVTSNNGKVQTRVYLPIVNPDEVSKKVNRFHEQLANRDPAYANEARELYSLLIAPAKEQLSNAETICIVPDSFLWNLPFQALKPSSGHFLIEDYALYYAPSLSVLLEMTKKQQLNRGQQSLIAFGNPVIGKDDQRDTDLCPLPEAETEVADISKRFASTSTKVLIGKDASEKNFKNLASHYTSIHLATHGVLDNRHPLYSHLLLTKTDGEVENDGLLEAREIMNLQLSADLAVLSACETANGRISPGEGVTGMSWAFFMAGTRSLLVSQWKVNSASTSQLMSKLYDAFRARDSTTKARGLKSASLKLLKNPDTRHPFYWAAFVLIGSEN
jgi:CHAT domain-containing protein